MYETLSIYPEDKVECYQLLQNQLTALLKNETHLIPNLSNAAALLAGALKDINWVGFYLIHDTSYYWDLSRVSLPVYTSPSVKVYAAQPFLSVKHN